MNTLLTIISQGFFATPLEQFIIYPIIPLRIGFIDISFTNGLIISALILIATLITAAALMLDYAGLIKGNNFKIIPNYWQSFIEILHKATLSIVVGNISDDSAQDFFPLVCTVFFLILSINLIGLVPYSFTITSHLIVTFTIGIACFFGINVILNERQGIKGFVMFLPAGTSVPLALLLVPIELISYIFKPISLSVRLFANMMAGHTLLKVVMGFGYTIIASAFGFVLLSIIPFTMIVLFLFLLETAVAVIQAYVFSVLICVYLNDVLSLH